MHVRYWSLGHLLMRERFCKVCRGWHELDKWPGNCMPERILSASDLPAPMLLQDSMEPTQSMVDGQYYTSKAALRSTYKPSGNKEGKRYVELGDDKSITQPFKKPRPKREEIKAAVGKAMSQAGLGA